MFKVLSAIALIFSIFALALSIQISYETSEKIVKLAELESRVSNLESDLKKTRDDLFGLEDRTLKEFGEIRREDLGRIDEEIRSIHNKIGELSRQR